MKGGVGKTTLAFNLSWYSAWCAKLKVLAIDLDPQANLSQYCMGAKKYLTYLNEENGTIVEIFERFSAPRQKRSSPKPVSSDNVIHSLREWKDGSLLHLIPSRLELSWTLKNPTEKAQLLPQFLAEVSDRYDLIVIDCAPTESILTTAAYRASRYIIVPVKPEFLATIGFPLLVRSLEEFRLKYQDQTIDMAGIVFNDMKRHPSREQSTSMKDVKKLADEFNWPIFQNIANHSDSYPTGSRKSEPIFRTNYARWNVKNEFSGVAEEFLKAVGLK